MNQNDFPHLLDLITYLSDADLLLIFWILSITIILSPAVDWHKLKNSSINYVYSLFHITPTSFIGHYLDPRGYYIEVIVPESVIDAKKLSMIADGNNLYYMIEYKNGKQIKCIVPANQKQVWFRLKSELGF